MPFRYGEVGNRLKADLLGSGLSADEIANNSISPWPKAFHLIA